MANRCANCNNIVIEGETYCPVCKALPPEMRNIKRAEQAIDNNVAETKKSHEDENTVLLKQLISIQEKTQQEIDSISNTVSFFRKVITVLIVINAVNAAAALISAIFFH